MDTIYLKYYGSKNLYTYKKLYNDVWFELLQKL